MPIEFACSSCGKRLRVKDAAAGKRVKCPGCETLLRVPGGAAAPASTAGAAAPSAPAPEMWYAKTEDDQTFGPVPRPELDEWAVEGRLTADSQILREGSDQWQWATDLYPQLGQAQEPAEAAPDAAAGPAGDPDNPFAFAAADTAGDPDNPFAFAAADTAGDPDNPFAFAATDTAPTTRVGGSRSRRGRRGGKARATASGETSDKSKMVAGLLGVFLGGWGIHRFYLGYTGIGVIQVCVTLFTCVGGLWGVVEGIMILMGSFDRDARGRKLRD